MGMQALNCVGPVRVANVLCELARIHLFAHIRYNPHTDWHSGKMTSGFSCSELHL